MKGILAIPISAIAVLLAVIVCAAPAAGAAPAYSATIPLLRWRLFSTDDPAEVYQVNVPNTVLGALLDNGTRYNFDPFYGKNLALINETDFLVPWVFQIDVSLNNITEPSAETRILLQLEGINYWGLLTVNGVVAANESELQGAFRRYLLDITPLVSLSAGNNNVLSIQVTPESHTPGHWRSHNTALAYNFMDWNPHPQDMSMGVYRTAQIHVLQRPPNNHDTPLLTVDGFAVKTVLPEALPGTPILALLNASFVVRSWEVSEVVTTFVIDFGFNVTNASGQLQPVRLSSGFVHLPPAVRSGPHGQLAPSETRVFVSWEDFPQLVVQDPDLWWPWQMGPQTMFNGTVFLADGATVLMPPTTYALREVRQELNRGGALQFFLNNLPIQFRGGGWTSELFTREKSSNRLMKEFSLIRDMGLNGLRLEGMLETDLFYDTADQFGMLLLAGLPCCDGWQNWSYWPQTNYPIARKSVADQARRLERHPSVIAFLEASDSLPPSAVEAMYLKTLVDEAWPNAIVSSASQQVSNISGNPGVKMVGPYSWVPPSYWLADGNGLVNGNYGGAWGFFTEGGPGESPMTLASWNRTVPAEDIWNNDTQSMDSWWSFHMGQPYGHFRNLTYYTPPLNARYGESTSARQYLYRAQAANYEGIRAFMEGYSRNKHINATGFVQWMMNNAWPSHLWHLYDYYLIGGGGYYGAKMACQDLHVMLSYTDGSVWIINSRFYDFGAVTVTVDVLNLTGGVQWTVQETVSAVPADASFVLQGLGNVPINGQPWFSAQETFFVRAKWSYVDPSGGQQVRKENWYWLSPTPDVLDFPASNGFRTPCSSWTNFTQLNSLQPAQVTVELASLSPQQLQVTLTASPSNPTVAFFVYVRLVNTTSGLDIGPQFWDDNFITLLPGGSRTLHVSCILDDQFVLSEIVTVVESWNDQVAQP